MVVSAILLTLAFRPQRVAYPMSDFELIRFAEACSAYVGKRHPLVPGEDNAAHHRAAQDAVRAERLPQLAACAIWNRKRNASQRLLRDVAFVTVFLGLSLATAGLWCDLFLIRIATP